MSDGNQAQAAPTRKFGELRRTPAVSVVVIAGGEPEALRRCLEGLLRQDFFNDRFEIIAVDPDHLDTLRQVVVEAALRAAGMPSVQYLVSDGREGLAAARNRGWMYSRGTVLAFIDADEVPAPDWLSRGMTALKPGVAAIRGTVRVDLSASASSHQHDVAEMAALGLVGSNSFVHRLALIAVGGFDERFSAAWHSDADLQFMLIEHFRDRQRVRPEPLAEVVWQPRPIGWDASLRRQRLRQFDVMLNAKHPTLYRELYGSIRHDLHHAGQLLMVGLLALASAALLVANFLVAIVAIAIWTTLTAGICVYRLNGRRHQPTEILGTVLTAIALPPLAVFWRLIGALRFHIKPESRVS